MLAPWKKSCDKPSGCHFLLQCVKVKSEREVTQSWPHGLQPTRLLHPWDFPGKSTGVECHCLLPSKTLLTKRGTKRLHFSMFSDKNLQQKLIQSPNKEMLQIFNFSLSFYRKPVWETYIDLGIIYSRQGSTPIYPDLNFFKKWHYNMLTFQWQQKVFD